VGSDRAALGLHAQSDLDVRLRLLVGVVFGVLSESLCKSACKRSSMREQN
jgi:hypothetical protein